MAMRGRSLAGRTLWSGQLPRKIGRARQPILHCQASSEKSSLDFMQPMVGVVIHRIDTIADQEPIAAERQDRLSFLDRAEIETRPVIWGKQTIGTERIKEVELVLAGKHGPVFFGPRYREIHSGH